MDLGESSPLPGKKGRRSTTPVRIWRGRKPGEKGEANKSKTGRGLHAVEPYSGKKGKSDRTEPNVGARGAGADKPLMVGVRNNHIPDTIKKALQLREKCGDHLERGRKGRQVNPREPKAAR